MPSDEEWRKLLGRDFSDDDLAEFLWGLRGFLNTFLDDYFRDELNDDDLIDSSN